MIGRTLRTRLYRYLARWRYAPPLHALRQSLALSAKDEGLLRALQFVRHNRIPGDYVEFGVREGQTLIAAEALARLIGLEGMSFWGLDSFGGLPASEGVFTRGQFAADRMNVERALRRARSRARLVAGWFHEYERLPTDAVAIAYIDCDLYTSTVEALRLLTPALQDGTVLLFDDWFSFKGRRTAGEQRAFDEWLQKHAEWTAVPYGQFGFHGQRVILLRE